MTSPAHSRADTLPRPLRAFLDVEVGSTVVLLAATVTALVWANLPFGETYEQFWSLRLDIRAADSVLHLDLRHWVNDGLMALFFFVVGLELAREFTHGEMRDRRKAAVPVLAAVGGFTAPALVYLALNAGTPGAAGFGVVMATDTAFALGLLSLLGPRCPAPLRRFMLTLAVIDDVGAIVLIAAVYTGSVQLVPMTVALVLLAVVLAMRRVGIWRAPPYALVAVGIWLATVLSGVHPTVVGIALGVLMQVYAPAQAGPEHVRNLVDRFREEPTARRGREAAAGVRAAVPTNDRLQLLLHPWTSYVVVPLFALANAGIPLNADVLSRAVTSPVSVGIVVALVVGKLVGVVGGSWVALRTRLGTLPGNLVWGQLTGGAAVAGIGFTVSLFIAELAFADEALHTDAKVGILFGSLLAAGLGWLVFRLAWDRGAQCAPPGESVADVDILSEPVSDLDHTRGADDAPVTLVEYGDFECPYCGRMYPVVEALAERYGERLRIVFRHLPVREMHPHAWAAALAAEAAARHDKFWAMHARLFADQHHLEEPDLRSRAEALAIPSDDVVGAAARRYEVDVQADLRSGRHSGANGTPTFYVNGRRFDGRLTYEGLVEQIELAAASSDTDDAP